MLLEQVLFLQGFGTRRVCAGIVQKNILKIKSLKNGDFYNYSNAEQDINPYEYEFQVDKDNFLFREKAYLMLYKPSHFECSRKPSAYPSVYTLLPSYVRQRPITGATQGIQAVGRLDCDTTGLLLFSDDGKFIHRMTSPKHRMKKKYRITAKHLLTDTQINQLLSGVVLDDDPNPVIADEIMRVSENIVDMVITQGKYHQVKRMISAIGNRVNCLHRLSIGNVVLDDGMTEKNWRWLSHDEFLSLNDS